MSKHRDDWLPPLARLGNRIGYPYYFVADLPREKYRRVKEINQQFDQLSLGFVDAAIVAISEILGLSQIATTDRPHSR